MRRTIFLINMPTFPKGVLSLGIPAVAAVLSNEFEVKAIDLNMVGMANLPFDGPAFSKSFFIGLSVSAQNIDLAKKITQRIKAQSPKIPIVWGGEYPTLMPENAIEHADSIVRGSFEPVADALISDLKKDISGIVYDGRGKYDLTHLPVPKLDVIENQRAYYQFMGMPVETSKGCDKRCTFCMVHVMQSKQGLKPVSILKQELIGHKGKFVNVVDYNIGVHRDHILQVAELFRTSEVLGWMTELCLESLDDDEVLEALARSRCRIVYCGLETLDESSLKSINKAHTNHLENFERIIRKAQKHGVQIGAGLILGIEGTHAGTFERMLKQFSDWGIIYTKLTFLTYNPGTKVKVSMAKKGTYVTEELNRYDGNHLTFMAHGVESKAVHDGSRRFISGFYRFRSVMARSHRSGLKGLKRFEFILFCLCYRKVYMDWLKYRIFDDDEGFQTLLHRPFRKSFPIRLFESLLHRVRAINYKKDRP